MQYELAESKHIDSKRPWIIQIGMRSVFVLHLVLYSRFVFGL